MKITPAFVSTFETDLQTWIQDAWKRRLSNLYWDLFMETKQSQTLRELYFWLLETAKIQTEGQGGNKRFDDIAATFLEIDNVNSGNGLRLTKNEIEDNMMANPRGMPALVYSESWARQMGGAAAYWPQDLLFNTLIPNGKTANAYDAVPFFSKVHPINPNNSGGSKFANLLQGASGTDGGGLAYPGACPIDTTNATTLEAAQLNFANAVSYVRSLTQPNGKKRGLKPKFAVCGVTDQRRIMQILDAKYYGSGAGATENVLTKYGIEPVIADELGEPGVWYLACEALPGEGSAFIFQDRSPYVLTSYQPETLAELQRRKEFEWSFDGRNAGAYGHPYLFFRIEPT